MGVPPALLGNYDKLTGQPTDNPKSCSQISVKNPKFLPSSFGSAGSSPDVRRISVRSGGSNWKAGIWYLGIGFGKEIWDLGTVGIPAQEGLEWRNRVGNEGAKCTISRFLSNVSRFLMIVFCFLTTLYQYRKNVSQYFSIILFSNT